MRVLLAMLMLYSCAAPRQIIDNDISIELSRHQPSIIRSQTALMICEGRSGPMASWAFAREIRLVCSEQRSELLIEFAAVAPPPSPSPLFEPRILCGGTVGPSNEAEARQHERSCQGRSGWIEPVRE